MKIVQKIDTGGTSKTRMPMLKFRINELLFPREARHMTHWAKVVVAPKCRKSASINTASAARIRSDLALGKCMATFICGPLGRRKVAL